MEFLKKFSPKAKSKKLPKSKQEPQGSPAQFVGLPHTIKSVDGSQNLELREDGWSIFGDGGGWPLIGVELLEVEVSSRSDDKDPFCLFSFFLQAIQVQPRHAPQKTH